MGALAAMTVCGSVCAMMFDMFRAVRTLKKHGKYLTAAEDAVFCTASAFMIWKCLWIFGGGALRMFEVLGFAIGVILYILVLQRVFFRIFTVIFKNIFKIFDFIFQILLTPLKFLYKILLVPLYLPVKARRKKCNDGKVFSDGQSKRKGAEIL